MKKKDTLVNEEELQEFDRKNLILLLELFILVFITLLFCLAFKDSKDNNSKVISRGLTKQYNVGVASQDVSEWLLNSHEGLLTFDVVSVKESSNTCYNFIVKYSCDDNKDDCILIDNNNLSSKTDSGSILSAGIDYSSGSYKIVEECE